MTFSEENYLKGISSHVVSNSEVSTNAIAEMMDTKSSVTDMLKKLAEKIW
jgi:DtxR family Mn-dependent transcriptional regulator